MQAEAAEDLADRIFAREEPADEADQAGDRPADEPEDEGSDHAV
jgi:hypothetical protein